ncbi:MAG: hypothetical protein CTY10_01245 [Methylotenera sp.]|nr:MAG: hypothetical protein CTY10_01245 [Methylotenera sp.]
MMILTTVEQLSAKIHKATSSIYSDLIRNPKSLPPVFRIVGSRRVLFRDVDQWLSDQSQSLPTPQPAAEALRKRGRPTKAEQIQRALSTQ